jgi:catalase
MRPTNTNVDDKSAASGSNEKRMPAGKITNPALAQLLLQAFDEFFGLHPGFRPAHAKGLMCAGVFTPSPEATNLTRAPHAARPLTPVTVRFVLFG